MLLGGRFLVGIGCSTAATSGKSYLSEVTSPWNRGRYMGLQNSFYYVGQLLASGIAIPTGRIASDWSWRVPMLLQCAMALINIAFVMFLPESPRWLYSRGHEEKALKIMAHLHSRDNDIQSPLIQMEVAEFHESIKLDGADKRWWDFRPVFNTGAARYRFGLCVMVSCWGQLSGNGLITCEFASAAVPTGPVAYARLPPYSSPPGRYHQPRPPARSQLCQLDHLVHRCSVWYRYRRQGRTS